MLLTRPMTHLAGTIINKTTTRMKSARGGSDTENDPRKKKLGLVRPLATEMEIYIWPPDHGIVAPCSRSIGRHSIEET